MGQSFAKTNYRNFGKYGPLRTQFRLTKTAQLAARVECSPYMTPGVQYARHRIHATRTKEVARTAVVQFFDRWNFPGQLHILTMPGLTWCFEKQLYAQRGMQRFRELAMGGLNPKWNSATRVYGIECDEAIYRAAIQQCPGAKLSIRCTSAYDIRTPFIKSFRKIDFSEVTTEHYDGAWLDFNGPITSKRLGEIQEFWSHIRFGLAITWMNARHDAAVTEQIKEYASPVDWLLHKLPGAVFVSADSYTTGHVPMLQLLVHKNLTVKNPFGDE
jgi:hypothetical protein